MSKNSGFGKMILFLSIIAIIFILSRVFGLGEILGNLRVWIQNTGVLGIIVFILIYSFGTIFAIPGSALTIAAGSLFGSFKGVIIVSIASTLGAALSFLAARYFAREFISNRVGKNEKFKKLDELTQKHGNIIVAIVRLVPIFPYTLSNYGFGLTRIPFSTYVFWSWLCMLPGTVLYVVGTDTVVRMIFEKKVPWPLIAILVIVILSITFIVKKAQKKLNS